MVSLQEFPWSPWRNFIETLKNKDEEDKRVFYGKFLNRNQISDISQQLHTKKGLASPSWDFLYSICFMGSISRLVRHLPHHRLFRYFDKIFDKVLFISSWTKFQKLFHWLSTFSTFLTLRDMKILKRGDIINKI